MTRRQVLIDKIKGTLTEPKHFQQIEDVVGKQKAFLLGRTLMDMAIKGEIHYAESDKYQTEHAMYSMTPFLPNYRHPLRDESVTPKKR